MSAPMAGARRRSRPMCSRAQAQELEPRDIAADFPGPMLSMFPESGAAMCPQDWCAHLPDEINLDTPCSP